MTLQTQAPGGVAQPISSAKVAVLRDGLGITQIAAALAAMRMPITVSGDGAIGSVYTATVGPAWIVLGGNWARIIAGAAQTIPGATGLQYTSVPADAGLEITYLPSNLPYRAPGVLVAANGTAPAPSPTPSPAPAPGGTLSVRQQPTAQSVQVGRSAVFVADIDPGAGGALSLQWRFKGIPIPGANALTFVTPPLATADSGGLYTLVAANSAGSVVTNAVAVTVTPATGSSANPTPITVLSPRSPDLTQYGADFGSTSTNVPPPAFQFGSTVGIMGGDGYVQFDCPDTDSSSYFIFKAPGASHDSAGERIAFIYLAETGAVYSGINGNDQTSQAAAGSSVRFGRRGGNTIYSAMRSPGTDVWADLYVYPVTNSDPIRVDMGVGFTPGKRSRAPISSGVAVMAPAITFAEALADGSGVEVTLSEGYDHLPDSSALLLSAHAVTAISAVDGDATKFRLATTPAVIREEAPKLSFISPSTPLRGANTNLPMLTVGQVPVSTGRIVAGGAYLPSAVAEIGINLGGYGYFDPPNTLVNMVEQGHDAFRVPDDSHDNLYNVTRCAVDANGWPLSDFFWEPHWQEDGPTKTCHGSCTGWVDSIGVIQTGNTRWSVANHQYDPVSNKTTFDLLVAPGDQRSFGIFSMIGTRRVGGATGAVNTGVTDLVVAHPGYAISDIAAKVWTDEYVAYMSRFECIRMMDAMGTNGSPIVNISDFRMSSTPIGGLGMDKLILLCNKANCDIWINMGFHFSDDCVRAMVDFVHAHLSPGLKCYVEYSNETWNPQFESFQASVNNAQAEISGSALTNLNLGGQGDIYYLAQRWVIRRAMQISDLVRERVGDSKIGNRFRIVWADKTGSNDEFSDALEYIAKAFPQRPVGGKYGYFQDYAGAPYFFSDFGGSNGDQSVTEQMLLADLSAKIVSAKAGYHYERRMATALQFGLVATWYEGGPDLTFPFQQGYNDYSDGIRHQVQLDPGLQSPVQSTLTSWFAAGGGLTCWYNSGIRKVTDRGAYDSWFITDSLANLQSPKLLAFAALQVQPKTLAPKSAVITAVGTTVLDGRLYLDSYDTSAALPGLRLPSQDNLRYAIYADADCQKTLVINASCVQGGAFFVRCNFVDVVDLQQIVTGDLHTFVNYPPVTVKLKKGFNLIHIGSRNFHYASDNWELFNSLTFS